MAIFIAKQFNPSIKLKALTSRRIHIIVKNNKLYKRVLSKQRYIFNLINYNLPLNQISETVKNEFPNKKIFNLF